MKLKILCLLRSTTHFTDIKHNINHIKVASRDGYTVLHIEHNINHTYIGR